ncbi:DNA/RNA polymerase [Linderina pennispora]|uniref:DNA/RNA polymerase n=1 Tax=Linderina pennispora TaxID=61395 RepID=A0A1Y1WLF7_9FUNG|nr:DNA/RNA polymerase [Linderina pennispora]ORX73924.1 DNA/RNA polymerase [Linderina pennispora]
MSNLTSKTTEDENDNSVVEYQLEPVLPDSERYGRSTYLATGEHKEPEGADSTMRLLGVEQAKESGTVVPGGKLAEQAEQRIAKLPAHETIFSGVVFHINGYTQPSHYELKRLLIERGGQFLHYLSKTKVTHIIASSLTLTKEKEFRHYKVVRPEWVVDSVRVGKQLSWHKYKLIGQGNTGVSIKAVNDPLSQLAAQRPTQDPGPSDLGLLARPAPVIDRFNEGLNRSWVRKNLASDKDFIKRYYENSRLHHMSAWRAEMKDYVAQLRSKYKKGTGADKVGRSQRIIMHVDFDCFFVTASLLSHPYLKDKPVVVCHSKQLQPSDSNQIDEDSLQGMGHPGSTSQIASCNYVARSFGVRNGMFLGPARERCPGLMTVPYYFDTYKRVSRKFYEELTQIADEIQAASIDEALLDVTEVVYRDFDGKPERLAQHIRQILLEQTQCTASIGIGSSILLARVATNKAKPDGVFAISAEQFEDIDLRVRDLPGVGYTLEQDLAQHNITSVKDIRKTALAELQAICGEKTGQTLYNHSRGIDDRVLESDKLRQVFGADVGWGLYAFDLLQQLKIDPLDIRSVGIQVSKLNSMDVAGDIGDLLTKPAADTSKPSGAIPVIELPSASQLDSSVFNELPESIRQELQAVYQQIDPSINIVQGKGALKTRATPTSSGSSSATRKPGRKASGSSGYSGRGRPRKLVFPPNSGSKGGQSLMQAFRKAEVLDPVMPSQMDRSVWEELPMNIRRELAREHTKTTPTPTTPTLARNEEDTASVGVAKDEGSTHAVPVLFNASSLDDVLDLVRQWVDAYSHGPLDEDVDEFSNYAASLVKFHDLSASERMLKHLKYWASSKGKGWQHACV